DRRPGEILVSHAAEARTPAGKHSGRCLPLSPLLHRICCDSKQIKTIVS
ncbi:hypothetical protein CEXT_329341, partial [Caerostris extrusa]